jgi:hypothetical protein
MANPHVGEVTLKSGERSYTLRFDMQTVFAFEGETGKSFFAEFSDSEMTRVTTVCVLLWAALRKHHPGIGRDEAAEIMIEAGGMVHVLEVMAPKLKPLVEALVGARPPAPDQALTGPASTGNGEA